MAAIPEVGPWAKEKLAALARYLDFYTTVLKNKKWWRTIYFDGYAGGGQATIRSEKRASPAGTSLFGEEPEDDDVCELIDGSPRIALAISNPFDRYIFVDPVPARIGELRSLKVEFDGSRTIDVVPGTASEGIDWLTSQPIAKSSHRGVAFLDPFGANLDWASVQKLAETGLFEVVVNFARNMAIVRMLPNSGVVPEGWAATLDSYFGGSEWFDEVYEPNGGLFDAPGHKKRHDYPERLLALYRRKLRAAFGYVSTARLIRNTRGAPLYYLVWAGPNRKGLEGADHILSMGERLTAL
jgi:three-Cys-motif partner protein